MAKTSRTIVFSRYFHLLDKPGIEHVYELLQSLLQMTDKQPELLMEVSPKYKRTFLHVAVMATSEVQVKKVLDMMLADMDVAPGIVTRNDRLSQDMEYLLTVESLSGCTAFQMACVVGHKGIVDMIKRCQKEINNSWNIPATSLESSSAVEPGEQGAASPQPLVPEGLELPKSDDIIQIGEMLKRCLEPLGLSDVPLNIMSLGDEFRLHTSLTTGASSIDKWIRYYRKENGVSKIKGILEGIVSKLDSRNLLRAFLKLQDKAGRHILHYLADFSRIDVDDREAEDTRDLIFETLMNKLREFDEFVELDMNVRDNVGRTPLHLAAAQGFEKRAKYFADHPKTDLNATFEMVSLEDEEEDYEIRNISPLSLATANNHHKIVKSLCSRIPKDEKPIDVRRDLLVNTPIVTQIRLLGHFQVRYPVKWTPLQLAAFKGHVETLNILLENDQEMDFDQESQHKHGGNIMNTLPVLHLAALGGKPHAIKALLKIATEKSWKIDPHEHDSDGNTALLYALQHSQFEDGSGPWNFVNMLQCFQHCTNEMPSLKNSRAIICCLDLLLQAGLDIDQRNKDGVTPQIGPHTPRDVQKWWYDKIAKELQETKQNVADATNAVSVVAALVATTSFVGPLQPPLGLSTNTDVENLWLLGYSQINHIAIDVFLFFDTLSFYLAIASIMLALISSLPIQRERLLSDVKKAQRYLQGAVVLLLASITSLICTFSAAAVAIIPEGRWKYKAIIVSTTIFGGIICFLVLVRSRKRLPVWTQIKNVTHTTFGGSGEQEMIRCSSSETPLEGANML